MLPTLAVHSPQQPDQPVEVEEKEAKGDDNDNGDNNNGDDDDDDGDDGDDDDDDDGDDNDDVKEEAEEVEEAAAAESNDVQMLVDEKLEVSTFTSVSSEKHLMLERILRTAGSQRLPRELLPLQESGRARPWGWVGLLQSAVHRRGSTLPVLFTSTP